MRINNDYFRSKKNFRRLTKFNFSYDTDVLKSISKKTCLSEGEEAIREILREIYRNFKITTKDLAYATRLPLPVVAAIRRELEKIGFVHEILDKGR